MFVVVNKHALFSPLLRNYNKQRSVQSLCDDLTKNRRPLPFIPRKPLIIVSHKFRYHKGEGKKTLCLSYGHPRWRARSFFVALVGILPVSVGGIIKSLISLSLKQKNYSRLCSSLSGKMLESIVSQPSSYTGEIIRRRNREHVSLFFRQKDISTKQVDDSSLAFLTTTNLKRAEEQRRNFPITYRQKKPSETSSAVSHFVKYEAGGQMNIRLGCWSGMHAGVPFISRRNH